MKPSTQTLEAYPNQDEVEYFQAKRTAKLKLLAVTLFLILINGVYFFINREVSVRWAIFDALAGLSLMGLLGVHFLRRFQFNNQALAFTDILVAVIISSAVAATGLLQSPLLFLVFLIPFLGSLEFSFATPTSLSATEVIVLGFFSLLDPFTNIEISQNPLHFGLTLFAPLILGVALSQLLKKIVNLDEDKEETVKIVQSLLEQKVKLDRLLEAMPEGLIITDTQGLILVASRKALEVLQGSVSNLVGQSIQQVLPVEQLPEKSGEQIEIQLNSFEGQTIIINLSCYDLLNEGGKVTSKVFLLKDVTAQKQFEDMKTDFVAIAAHELRTPLTSMRSYLSVLSENAWKKLDLDERQYLSRAIISTNQIFSLIENLLSVSRIEEGKLKLNLEPVLLEDIIKEVLSNLVTAANTKNIKLVLEKQYPNMPEVLGDKFLLGEAINNLVSNGIEFTKDGGYVRVVLQISDASLVVHVSDNGMGISSVDLSHLFTKFYRVSHGLAQHSKGIGLGLYIARSIIEAHGGKIWATSIENQGSTFSFILPQIQAKS